MAGNTEDIKSLIESILREKSDFAFEMEILNELKHRKYRTDHSGTYVDPYTKINREFDIRAKKEITQDCHSWLAVECKNISRELPLIIHSTAGRLEEKEHSLMINHSGFRLEDTQSFENPITGTVMTAIPTEINTDFCPYNRSYCETVGFRHDKSNSIFHSLYSRFKFIGKSMDKLKKKGHQSNPEYTLNDGEIYQKFSQAQNSLIDLIGESSHLKFNQGMNQFLLLPVLVVPNGSIWEQRYKDDGSPSGEISLIDRIPFYVNKTFDREIGQDYPSYLLRNVELVTVTGLHQLLDQIEREGETKELFLDKDRLVKSYKNRVLSD